MSDNKTGSNAEALLSEAAPRLSAPDLLEILHAPNWEKLRETMQRVLMKLGMCDFCLKMDIFCANGKPSTQKFSSLPNSWLQLFSNPPHGKTDPIQQHLSRSSLPLNWQVEQLCVLDGGQIYPLLKSMGITHGMSLATHRKNAVSRLDFYYNVTRPMALDINAQANALLLGVHLQEAAELLWCKTIPNQPPLLSLRELECLRWSAEGKTSFEIGVILGISQRTVYFHLRNVVMKLGVYSTRHAISKAIMMEIIKPAH
ncbi:DNA-binding transcriptional regulator, CsgD family [Collimonas sp. OK242]|jgi:DNA-binding CsgD family transcriptional regulator|uniref:helix-turn-helix transcriptional regulator n=1 Tax=Collimonas sp. OK242 TaxID=1798195 RepID=UPI00089B8E00|nr:LuxR family transcriptional regulator [Collimonas sp. OK242]SDY00022.1 DNA-binding transcriptional regulator, CsgD family [Collimonas sp. OK242]